MMRAQSTSFLRRLRFSRLRDVARGRLDASLDWPSIVAAADLPDDISQTVRQVVRQTRLSRAEKVDVARELVAHFADGLSTGRTPLQLRSAFGAPKLAARLIGRAKKRGRSLLWHVWLWSRRALGVMFAIYVAMGLYLLTGTPSIKTDYLAIVNARASAVPDADRAWPLYREALLEMGVRFSQADRYSSPFGLAENARPHDARWNNAVHFLADHEASIEKIRAATRRASLGMPLAPDRLSYAPEDRVLFSATPAGARREFPSLEDRPLTLTKLPHMEILREVGDVLATDCRRAAVDGDARIALADVFAQLALSRHVQESPFYATALVAAAIQGTCFNTIRDNLADHADVWSGEQLHELAYEVARTDVDWRRALDGERAIFYDVVQRVYTDDGNGDGRVSQAGIDFLAKIAMHQDLTDPDAARLNRGLAFAALPATNLLLASRQEMTGMYDRSLERLARELSTPVWEWNLPIDRAAPFQEQLRSSSYRYWLVSLFALPVDTAAAAEFRRGTKDGVLIGIALELYLRDHGAWPTSLEQLTQRWLSVIPTDRITGNALRYKLVDGRPIVYSVGIDHDDDDGRLPPHPYETPNAAFAGAGQWTANRPNDPRWDGDWIIWSTKQGAGSMAQRGEK